MVRKVAKGSSLKSTSLKTAAGKSKEEEQLSNGHADSENEQTENTAEAEVPQSKSIAKIAPENSAVSESGEKVSDVPQPQESTSITAEQQKPEEESEALPENPETTQKSSRKRKTPAVPKEDKNAAKTKSKRKKGGTSEAQASTSADIPEQQESEEDLPEKSKTNRKRKTAPKGKKEEKEAVPKTKAKRQKILLEIPKINSVTGKVFVIGENDVGQLGLGENIDSKTRPALLDLPHSIVDIAAGGMHSVCLTERGEVITFGCNDEGALGRVTSEEGSEYTPGIVDIPERIIQVSAGDSHSAALADSGQVYIWGNFRNLSGPMGLVAEGTSQNAPVRILNGVIAVKIASGSDHLVCLTQEGTIYTCGCGDAGQLGRVSENASAHGGRRGRMLLLTPDKVSIARSNKTLLVNNIWTGSYATFANIRESGHIYAFGLNNYNQLGHESQNTIMRPMHIRSFNDRNWSQIIGGQHHTLALNDTGLVHSLGRDDYGRLGLGENCGVKIVPTEISTLQDKKCLDIGCGNIVSLAVTDNGNVFSWGMGTNSQLGHGNDEDQHTPRQIEGNFLNSWKAFKISGGGQHTLILATPRESLEKSQ